MLRRRKASAKDENSPPDQSPPSPKKEKSFKQTKASHKWKCIDNCCWLVGNVTVFWLLLYVSFQSLPKRKITDTIQHVLGVEYEDTPAEKVKKDGLKVKHPVVFIPGIVTCGLELWEGRECTEGLFRKRLWGGTFGEVYKRPGCWMDHMVLDNETGLDPPGVRVRPVSGLVAADYFMPGYFVWAIIIEQLAKIGYEEKHMHMASYDWRLSFLNTEARDKSLSRLKSNIELLVQTNGEKVVAVPHSMGAIYFLFFLKWVEAPKAEGGGGGGEDWTKRHIHGILNIGGPFLGVPKAFTGLFSAEAKDIAVAREIAPFVVDKLQTLQHVMRTTRTWESPMSMLPKGGEVIWGGIDTSAEEEYFCPFPQKFHEGNSSRPCSHNKPYYGRMVAFGKNTAIRPSKELQSQFDYKDIKLNHEDENTKIRSSNIPCGEHWTEYHEMTWQAVVQVAQHGIYTAKDGPGGILALLREVAPKMMARADKNWGYGIADDLDDVEYKNPKHWSNPLETKLPDAPDLEIYCMYGVGIPTERAYVYKLSPYNDTCMIPFQIDSSVDPQSCNDPQPACMKDGVLFADGDETVPVLSAGFMCAKGWRGKTRFNPSGSKTYVREYEHTPPTSMLNGRGSLSGSHVDIMGNFALIEDILRIVTGTTGESLGDKISSQIMEWADKIDLKL